MLTPDIRLLPKIALDRSDSECCTAVIASQCVGVISMNEVVDRVLDSYGLDRGLDPVRVAQSREKILRYIDTLASAGQNDAHQLAIYALAYLKELHEGPDSRFTGC
jgi:hypothetical protein